MRLETQDKKQIAAWFHRVSYLMSLVSCLVLTGCLRRSLTIRTDPPGALVYVNDQLKGKSPVTYDFEWYGWHRLMVRKDGYQRLDDRRQLRAPLYLWIPLDLFAELVPWAVYDRYAWSYALTPAIPQPAPTPPPLIPASPPTAPPAAPTEQPSSSAPSVQSTERNQVQAPATSGPAATESTNATR